MSAAVGTTLGPWTIASVDPERMKQLAVLLADPNPIHLDAQIVRDLGLGPTVINQGPANLGYIINLLQSELPGSELRHLKVRFLANVFGEEEVNARAEVTGVSDAADGAQLLELDIWLEAGDRGRALAGTAMLAVPA
jgi:3-hydroxybutyryl-CoA dehydratase